MHTRAWKEIILGILTTSALISTLWFWKTILPQILSGTLDYQNFFLPLGMAVASATLFLCTALFIKTIWMSYCFPIVGIIGGILFSGFNYTTLIVSGICLLLTLSAIHRVRREFMLSHGFSLSKLSKAGLPLFFTILSLAIALLYTEHITDKNAINAFLPKSAFTVLLGSLSRPLSSLTGLPSINPHATIDETINSIVQEELKKQGIIVDETSKAELQRLVTTQRNVLAKQYGIRVNGNEKTSDILYTLAADRVTDLLGPYTAYLPIVAGAGFFFAFKALTIPLYYLALLAVFLLIKIGIASKILTREQRQITVERLVL